MTALDGNVVDQNDMPVEGALVYIYDQDGDLAELTDALGQPADNPQVSGQNGYWQANVAEEGFYTARYYWGGRLRRIDANILAGRDPVRQAQDEAHRSQDAADFAEGFTGPVFASVEDGEAATTPGQIFRVSNGDGPPETTTAYRRTSGGSVVQAPLATTAALASTEGAGMVAKADGGLVQQELFSTATELASSTLVGQVGSIWKAGGLRFEQVASDPHVTTAGGAMLQIVPETTASFTIGDGTTAGTAFEPSDGDRYNFHGKTLIHRARNAANQGQLFTLEDVNDVIVENVKIDGESEIRNGITLKGVARNITLRDIQFINLENFGIQYADLDFDPLTAYFENVTLENITLGGDVGIVGDGSGINFFCRSKTGDLPTSKNLKLINLSLDVSMGNTDRTTHGPQALKLNNVDGVTGRDLFLRGGNLGALNMMNGTQRVRLFGVITEFANRGVIIDTVGSTATDGGPGETDLSNVITQDIEIHGFSYRKRGVVGEGYGVYLSGGVKGVRFFGADMDGDFVIAHTTTVASNVLEGVKVHGLVLKSGALLRLLDPGSVIADVEGAVFRDIVADTPISSDGAIQTGSANRAFNRSIFENVLISAAPHNSIKNYGTANEFRSIVIDGGNTNAATTACAINDFGNDTVVDGLELRGANVPSYFVIKRSGGAGLKLRNLRGTPGNAAGFLIQGQENGPLIEGDVRVETAEIALSDPAVGNTTFFTADKTTYILGVAFIYTEASSADAGVNVTLAKSGSTILTYPSEASKALGAQVFYQNTTGTRAFSTRKLVAGDRLQYGCVGGKVGTGKIKAVVTLVTVDD